MHCQPLEPGLGCSISQLFLPGNAATISPLQCDTCTSISLLYFPFSSHVSQFSGCLPPEFKLTQKCRLSKHYSLNPLIPTHPYIRIWPNKKDISGLWSVKTFFQTLYVGVLRSPMPSPSIYCLHTSLTEMPPPATTYGPNRAKYRSADEFPDEWAKR